MEIFLKDISEISSNKKSFVPFNDYILYKETRVLQRKILQKMLANILNCVHFHD